MPHIIGRTAIFYVSGTPTTSAIIRFVSKMPLWRIYCHPDILSPEEKTGLAKSITTLYTNLGLPAFYVNVVFIDVPEQNFLIGGEQTKNMIRFSVEHVARAMPSAESEEGRERISKWMERISKVGSIARTARH
jgi:phenylpyruvate tautomerase PptA (4-oxalocrotonate tautomerase family)